MGYPLKVGLRSRRQSGVEANGGPD